MRIYLYILAGITSALIGWSLGQFALADLGLLKPVPEIVLFPCVATSLAIGMVLNEIFVSSPTRPKLNLRVAILPVGIAAGLGLAVGLAAGILAQVLFLPQIRIPAFIVRILSWLCIGGSIGLAEGLSWRWHSLEAGDKKRFRQRLKTSLIAGCVGGLTAAFLFELVRQVLGQLPREIAGIEDPVGFVLLGALLGLALSVSSSPSYISALRAGGGFEYTAYTSDKRSLIHEPLKFVSTSDENRIEEGLSIQLPATGKVVIGSGPQSNILIPGLPAHVAHIEVKAREATLIPDADHFNMVEVNGNRLSSSRSVALRHNFVLTLYTLDSRTANGKQFYRFVYYNRFLDPQA